MLSHEAAYPAIALPGLSQDYLPMALWGKTWNERGWM